jgi:multidrug efflux pump subunit AcrA (membrane-fusion protein)
LAFALWVPGAEAQDGFTVRSAPLSDQKAVFATVESLDVVPARARIGGTAGRLAVRAGDRVEAGQMLAVVADQKLLLQLGALDAQLAGLRSSLEQARADLARAETLFRQGSGPRVTMDQARTALEVAGAAIQARQAERSVIEQQIAEGAVLAPVAVVFIVYARAWPLCQCCSCRMPCGVLTWQRCAAAVWTYLWRARRIARREASARCVALRLLHHHDAIC